MVTKFGIARNSNLTIHFEQIDDDTPMVEAVYLGEVEVTDLYKEETILQLISDSTDVSITESIISNEGNA
jgi:hypothetical protein